MLPRSQHEQIRTWTRQRAQRYRRGVASACLPSSHRRGRKPPPMGYCPGIRASARCVGRGVETNFQVGIGAVPCLQQRQAFNSSSSAASPDASELSCSAHSDPAPQRALRAAVKARRWLLRHESRLREGAPDCSTATGSQKQRSARRRSGPLQRSQYESQIPERLRTATSRMMQPGPAWRQLTLGAN